VGPPLGGSGHERAAFHRTDDAWLADAWKRGRILLMSPRSAVLVDDDNLPTYVGADDVAEGAPRRFLGEIEQIPYFTATVGHDERNWKTLREVGLALDDVGAGLVVTSVALEQWHQRHRHCAVCGAATTETNAGWTRTCPADGSTHFPRTDPAVIMLIVDEATDRVLLGQGTGWPDGRYSTLAGFVEPGESLEAAVAREVFEETGVRIADVTYVASQPWPFPSSLMVGFTARLDGPDALTVDPVELADAAWFTRDEVRRAAEQTETWSGPLPETGDRLKILSPKLSISRFLVDRWLLGH